MTAGDSTDGRPLLFLSIVTALSIPFFVIGSVTDTVEIGALQLPVSAMMFVLPVAVAAAMVWQAAGQAGVGAFLRRAADRPAGPLRWYVIAALVIPVIAVCSHLVARWTGQVDRALPLSPAAAPVVLLVFAISATCEELGWTAYATDPLQRRFGEPATGLGLGVYWALWHLVPLLQAGHQTWWILGWFCGTVAARVLIVTLHNRTGHGVSAAIVLHTMLNVTSAYTPGLDQPVSTLVTGILTAVVAAVLLIGIRAAQNSHAGSVVARRANIEQS